MAKICVEFDPSDGNGTPEPIASYSATVGDGTSLVYSIDHDLGTRDILLSLRNIATGEMDLFDVEVTVPGPDQAILTFATAPAMANVRVNVLAVPAT
jgi:hypothetical protein